MNCQEITERLPWLLNGSLDAEEARLVVQHLEDCVACQAELSEVARVWEETSSHLPSHVVADYALGLELDFPRQLIEAHLAHCAACRHEVAIASGESVFGEEDPPETATTQHSRQRGWHYLAVAASLVAVSLGSALVWRVQQPELPRTNLSLVELLPDQQVTRSGTGTSIRIVRGAPAVLVLAPNDPLNQQSTYRALLSSETNREIWSASDLQPSSVGDFSVLMPTENLPVGPLLLTLFEANGASIATYSFSVVDGSAPDSESRLD